MCHWTISGVDVGQGEHSPNELQGKHISSEEMGQILCDTFCKSVSKQVNKKSIIDTVISKEMFECFYVMDVEGEGKERELVGYRCYLRLGSISTQNSSIFFTLHVNKKWTVLIVNVI